MGLYRDWLLPHLVDRAMRGEVFQAERPKCVGRLRGRVLELGFGSGHNLPHYPEGVSEVLALEPSAVARRLARERIARAAFAVRFVGLDGQAIPLDAGSVDAVLSTWTLCTIPDLARALAEVRRVLRPGGTLHFLEHGRSPDPRVARWQRRLEPLHRRIAGGCHLTRAFDDELPAAGFELLELERYHVEAPRLAAHTYLGVARPR